MRTASVALRVGVALAAAIFILFPLALPAHADKPIGGQDSLEGGVAPRDDAYEGSIFMNGADDVNAVSASPGGCVNCTWHLVVACRGNSTDTPDVLCMGSNANCPPGTTRFRVYLTRPPAPRRHFGDVCLGARQVTTQADVDAEVQRAIKNLPLLGAAPSLGQRSAPLANLATYFQASGQPVATTTVQLEGNELIITASATYRWDFGDGASTTTTAQGRSYRPGDDVRQPPGATDAVMHWYRTPAPVVAKLQTSWHATYTFITSNPIDVPGNVTPPAITLPVTVHAGRATLYN